MKNITMYQHAGSQNHGCEALARTIAAVIRKKNDGIFIGLASFEVEEDKKYGIENVVDVLYNHSSHINRFNLNWWKMQFAKAAHSSVLKEKLLTRLNWLNKGTPCDCYVAIGGDNYCYDAGKTFYPYDKKIQALGRKKVLIGCSIEPDDLNSDLIQVLKEFELITTRETITYDALQQVPGLKRVELIPDTAFTLPTIKKGLPDGFVEGKTIGINVSPLIMKYEEVEHATFENYCALIRHIINHTDYQIALIPHVVWKSSDDRIVLKKIYDLFSSSGRMILIEDCNCMELKGYISRCEMFIGARTHATIAAYSSLVPTLVVGYSVKAKGIAKDLFGNHEHYVLPVQRLSCETDLISAFDWLDDNRDAIKKHLSAIMPEYVNRVSYLGEVMRGILE